MSNDAYMTPQDLIDEAHKIVRGETMKLPTKDHLVALLNEREQMLCNYQRLLHNLEDYQKRIRDTQVTVEGMLYGGNLI